MISTQLQWWLIRLLALTAITGIIFDFEVLFIIQGFLLLHVKTGLEAVINDYVHDVIIRLSYLLFLRILILEALLCSLEFLL